MSGRSAARRAQLERLKDKRRAAREGRAGRRPIRNIGGYVAIGLNEPSGTAQPSYAQLLAELKRIAMGDVMPTPARFDFAKPATWATADQQCLQFGVSWDALRVEAGLKPNQARKAVNP